MFRLRLWEQIALSSVIGIAFACVMVVVFKAFWMPRADCNQPVEASGGRLEVRNAK
jgi:hypothetical protein